MLWIDWAHTVFKGFPRCILFMYRFDTSLKTPDVSIRYIAKIPNVSFRYMPKMLNVSKEYIKHFIMIFALENRLQPWGKDGTSSLDWRIPRNFDDLNAFFQYREGNVSFRYMECIVSIHVSNRYMANSQSLNVSIRYIDQLRSSWD